MIDVPSNQVKYSNLMIIFKYQFDKYVYVFFMQANYIYIKNDLLVVVMSWNT